jgi:hypothetical protein
LHAAPGRDIVDGREYRMPSTIDDPHALEVVADAARALGYPHKPL